jgi:4-aminobutyrate aminotransferase
VSERDISRSEAVLAREQEALGDILKLRFYPFVAAEAEGVRVRDPDGNEYLDMLASGGVMATGYRHPRVREAMIAELDRSWSTMHCCYPHERAVDLGERLCELLPGDFEKKAWFGATGSDANDCLATIAPMATGRRRMISFIGAYHGQTSGSALLSGHSAQANRVGGGNITKVPYPYPYRCQFGPCDPGECSGKCVRYIEETVLDSVSPAEDTAAIIMEAVQSDGGDIVPPDNVLPALRELCDRHGILLFFDEVKSGLGRTGRTFAFEHAGVTADAVSLGKPLGGGLPLSGVIARRELLDTPAFYLFTLGGSPAPCAAGLAVLDVIEAERLTENAAVMGERLLAGLEELKSRHELVGDVRGKGLLAGMELVRDRGTREPAPQETAKVVYRCYELGLLVMYTGLLGNVVEFTPPLTISEQDVDEALEILDRALHDVVAGRVDEAKVARFAGW